MKRSNRPNSRKNDDTERQGNTTQTSSLHQHLSLGSCPESPAVHCHIQIHAISSMNKSCPALKYSQAHTTLKYHPKSEGFLNSFEKEQLVTTHSTTSSTFHFFKSWFLLLVESFFGNCFDAVSILSGLKLAWVNYCLVSRSRQMVKC